MWQRAKLEVEFDVADSVSASSGTFVVKLPRKPGGIGITLSSKLNVLLMIYRIKIVVCFENIKGQKSKCTFDTGLNKLLNDGDFDRYIKSPIYHRVQSTVGSGIRVAG